MVKATVTIQNKTYTTFPNLVRNDKGFDIQFNVLLNDEVTPFDLTGGTIVFKARFLDATILKITGSCTIISATAGTCKYTVATGNLDTIGVLEAELEITQGVGGTIINTAKLGRITVLEDLP